MAETLAQKSARLRALRLANEDKRPKVIPVAHVYDFKDEMRFGKYKGKTIEQIMVDDINYVTWLLENVSSFTLSDEAESIYVELQDPRRPAWED